MGAFFFNSPPTAVVLPVTFYVSPFGKCLPAWRLATAPVQKAVPSHPDSTLCSLCDTFFTCSYNYSYNYSHYYNIISCNIT